MTKSQKERHQYRLEKLAEKGIYPSPEVYYDEVTLQQRIEFKKMNSLEGCGKISYDSDQYKRANSEQRQKILNHNQKLLDKQVDLQQNCMNIWLGALALFCFFGLLASVAGGI